MARKSRYIYALLALGCAAVAPAQEIEPTGPWGEAPRPDKPDQTALKIIDLHIKARGGQEALLAIKGIRMDGMLVEGIKDFKIETLHRRPNVLLVKSTRNHMGDDYVTIQVTDGTDTWTQELLPKRKNPTSLNANDAASLEIDARLPYLFLDAESSENTFAYMGETKFSGKKAYVIRVWMDNDDIVEALFDASSFHIVNYRQAYKIGPRNVLIDRVPTGLKRIEQTWWETGYDYRLRGKSFRSVTFKKIWFTPLPPMSTFKMPEVKERWLRSPS